MPGSTPIPNTTPLAALPGIVLDLETTGLNVRRDRVVQAAAIAMSGAEILDAPKLEQLIDPGIPIPPTATRIHGIADKDIAGAEQFPELAEKLQDLFTGCVVIGHHIGFDLAILRHEAARTGVAWEEPPSLDIALLVGALEPSLPDVALETAASHVGVDISDRHTAMGDSVAAAEIFSQLIAVLRERDIRTLGEAQAFASRRDDLMTRQVEQGWHEPVTAAAEPEAPPFQIDSFVFQRRLRDVMSAPLHFTDGRTSICESAKAMFARHIGCLLIGEEGRPPEGIVTIRDLLRAMVGGDHDPTTAPVSEIMSSPVIGMRGGELVYRALARMDRLDIRYLCVLDDSGNAIGIVSQRDLLQHRTRSSTIIDDALVEADSVQALAAAYGRVPHAATQLTGEGLDGVEVARIVSTELRALSRRSAALALQHMQDDGRGDAPATWCYFLLGSAGRGESLLSADQDNALIHTGTDADDAWFAEFGRRVSEYLDEAGVPLCKGGVMAANEQWRGTGDNWRERVANWLRRARPEDILNVDIFFDLVPVAGELELGHMLHRDAVQAASEKNAFLALLAASVESYTPQFSLFGKPVTDNGRIDLKRNGLLPLVGFARALSIRERSISRSTPGRLEDIREAGRLGEEDISHLIAIHKELMGHVLQQQIADLREGIPPSSRVELSRLTRDQRRSLRDGLHTLDDIVHQTRALISGR